jgi:hypothetical protein
MAVAARAGEKAPTGVEPVYQVLQTRSGPMNYHRFRMVEPKRDR